MTLLAWLAGLVLPACAAVGAQGLPAPTVLDVHHLRRPASPNTALAAPDAAGNGDITTPIYPVPASRLYAAVSAVAAAQPRTYQAAEFQLQMQLHWVVRSAMLNFPDLVTAQVEPAGPDGSTLLLYSRSVYGYSDLGVNRKRLAVWLAALDTTLNPSRER